MMDLSAESVAVGPECAGTQADMVLQFNVRISHVQKVVCGVGRVKLRKTSKLQTHVSVLHNEHIKEPGEMHIVTSFCSVHFILQP